MGRTEHNVTDLLIAWSGGDEAAFEQLVPLIYQELHRTAHRYMARERPATLSRPPLSSTRCICASWTSRR